MCIRDSVVEVGGPFDQIGRAAKEMGLLIDRATLANGAGEHECVGQQEHESGREQCAKAFNLHGDWELGLKGQIAQLDVVLVPSGNQALAAQRVIETRNDGITPGGQPIGPVSYTHLDVYKRQR